MAITSDYDLCIIGGGINGAGIAREAAGRGYSVLLVEAQDLGQGTSSASTKLIHGGLRYLEQFEFRLVHESLKERDILLSIAPHVIWPMDFVLPHVSTLRPKWMIALGLSLYDLLAGSSKIPKSGAVSFKNSLIGEPLQDSYADGFRYADCWADDSRLVVLNAVDAKERGADMMTRTACQKLERTDDGKSWIVHLKDLRRQDEFQITAHRVINAAGPWVRGILDASGLAHEDTPRIKLVKGSHLIVPKLYDGDHVYILQQPDKRIVFAIPYEKNYTLVGTTDEPFTGDAAKPVISPKEAQYLCDAVNRYFKKQITPADAPWTYSGVRALFNDGEDESQKITRDYKLYLDGNHGAPILSVFGGKLTTYRMVSVRAVDKIMGVTKNHGWTAKTPLPGGDIPHADFAAFLEAKKKKYKFLPEDVLHRYARSYGTRMDILLDGIDQLKNMGRDFGGGLYEKEIFYLLRYEFAQTVDDILWRRSKLGLHLEKKTVLALEAAFPDYLKAAGV
jgi:D-erythritol 1-phosphate dehydrogenase